MDVHNYAFVFYSLTHEFEDAHQLVSAKTLKGVIIFVADAHHELLLFIL